MITLFAFSVLALQDAPPNRLAEILRRFVYFPAGPEQGDWTLPEGCEEATIRVSDDVSLFAWWAPPPEGRPTVVFFHGNGGNVTHYRGLVDFLRGMQAGVLAVDYRGYGRSTGRPDEAGLYEDAEACFRWLTEERGVAARDLVAMGFSLGTGVAVELAVREHLGGVILEAPFTSIPNLVAERMGPRLAQLAPDRYDSISKIDRLDEPLLVLHGRNDTTVPFTHGQELHAAAPEPKSFCELPSSDHNDFLERDGELWRETVARFLDRE